MSFNTFTHRSNKILVKRELWSALFMVVHLSYEESLFHCRKVIFLKESESLRNLNGFTQYAQSSEHLRYAQSLVEHNQLVLQSSTSEPLHNRKRIGKIKD